MRLLAAARLGALGLSTKPTSARSRASKSGSDAGCDASTASNISVVMPLSVGALQVLRAQPFHEVVVDLGRDGLALRASASRQRAAAAAAMSARTLAISASSAEVQSSVSSAMRSTPMAARRRPNGSRVPLGFWPIAKMPASVSSLSAIATAIADAAGRQRIAGAARQVVIANRLRDHGRLAVGERVVAAHDALQFRELADHRGQQVALGQLRGARAWPQSAPMLRGDRCGQRADAPRARPASRAVPGRSRHRGRAPRGQRLLAVLLPEECGIGQARAHHALVAARTTWRDRGCRCC